MTNYLPVLDGRSGPKYRAIADAIADDIATGRLRPETRLPPHRDLAWRLGVTIGTVSRAYAEVARDGLVHGEVGRGTYVLGPRQARIDERLEPKIDNSLVEMTRNSPPLGPHSAALADTLRDIADRADCLALVQYREEAGPLVHRQAGQTFMRRINLEVDADNIVLCGGAQQALSLSLMALTAPGDTILVEAFSYCQFLDAVAFHGRRLHPVEMDEHGVVPEALEEACRTSGAKVALLIPTLHNPTNTILPLERRQAVADIADRHDLTIIEDDVYGYLPEQRPLPIAMLAPDRTVYITSASKSLAPGLRLGWIAAPERLVPRLVEAQHVTSVAQPPLTGEIARRWIEDGTADTLLCWLRRETAERNLLADDILGNLPTRGHPSSFHRLLPLPAPWTAEAFARAARERGVGILPATMFAALPGDGNEAVRLSLSEPPSRAALQRALKTLRDLLDSPVARPRAII